MYKTKQQIQMVKRVQSNIIFLHQHISVTSVTYIRLSYKKNTINTE